MLRITFRLLIPDSCFLRLFAAWYNFCRRHQTINATPAVAAGLADEPWSLERLLTESAGMAA